MISSPLMRSAYVAFGANLGDVEQTYARVHSKLQAISEGRQVRASRLLKTMPVGGPAEQPPYCNGCFEILGGPPHDVLFDRLMELERQFGRTRSSPWAPRTIDLDLLLTNDYVGRPDIEVPHPRLHYRRFVLEPLVELAPQLVHPWLLRTVTELLELAKLPNPTMLLFSSNRELNGAAIDAIRRQLPTATFVEYPSHGARPMCLPAQKRTIAIATSLACLPMPLFDVRGCWALLLGDADYAPASPAAAEPLPTFDARGATEAETLANVQVFIDSLGIQWSAV